MYRNFNLTNEERKTILEQHKQNGYKTSVNEMDINPDDYKPEPIDGHDLKDFESYYILVGHEGMDDSLKPKLLGGDSSRTMTYLNTSWLPIKGYRRKEFHDIDEMFSEIDGISKHFSSNPESAKSIAEKFKKFNGNLPFVVYSKNFKFKFDKSKPSWFSDKKSMDGKSKMDRYNDDINKF